MTYFNEWLKIMKNNIDCKKIKLNEETIHKFKCNCTYSFNYVTKKDDFELTCRNSKQNLLDIFYDHQLSLIRNKKFITDVSKSKSFKK